MNNINIVKSENSINGVNYLMRAFYHEFGDPMFLAPRYLEEQTTKWLFVNLAAAKELKLSEYRKKFLYRHQL